MAALGLAWFETREDALLTMRNIQYRRNELIIPKTLAPASGWGTTREDRRASLEEWFRCNGRLVALCSQSIEIDHETRRASFERTTAKTFRSSAVIRLNC
jgi:hypothetical protein